MSSYQLCKDILNASSSSPDIASLSPNTISRAVPKSSIGSTSKGSLDHDMFTAGPAYHQLMSDFFPSPNLLLEDGVAHSLHKQSWIDHLSTFSTDTTSQVRQIASKYVSLLLDPLAEGSDARIDLYDTLKSLSWEVLLGIFLDLSPSSSPEKFSQIESLQETLLRGQFSLFPVSINARIWQSPRSKGITARKELQDRLRKMVDAQEASCPFLKQGNVSRENAASHVLLFTSSIAVKALASLLTAFVMNLFLWRDQDQHQDQDHDRDESIGSRDGGSGKGMSTSLAELIRSQGAAHVRTRMLESILLETERLSPPVVGVMRRVQHDIVLNPDAPMQNLQRRSDDNKTNAGTHSDMSDSPPSVAAPATASPTTAHPIPAGHDVWLYLSGASRDPTIFGQSDADLFRFDRYMSSPLSSPLPTHSPHPNPNSPPTKEDEDTPPPPLTFSSGPKSCLGTDLVRQIVLTVGEVLLDSRLQMQGPVRDRGVRGWLGWEGAVAAEWTARGMKQLPVQRPREEVGVWIGVGGKIEGGG